MKTMKTYQCTSCDTVLKRHEAVLRGNVIDDEPTAWCRRDAVAAGIIDLPLPPLEVTVPQQRRETSLLRRLVGQR